MRILYLIDYNCPYSYIGLKRLLNAVENLNLDVEWEMRSYELEPLAENTPSRSTTENYIKKYGIAPNDAEIRIAEVEDIASEDGLEVNYRDMKIVSSRNALRLTKFVQNKHPETALELVLKIFESHLGKNENIADVNVLARIALSCGLDESEVMNVIENDHYSIEIDLDMEEALSNGIDATPCFILFSREERLIIPGAFSKEDFKIALGDFESGKIKNKTFV